MARKKESLRVSNSIEFQVAAPADARQLVDTKADLYADGSFGDYYYKGMVVSVKDEGNAYILSGADPTLEASWEKVRNDVELTQAQYTALSEEEKMNGTTYYITDGGAYVPAIDLIPYVNQAPIVVGKLDIRGDGEFRDIKRVRLWINDLQNASEIITAGWVETGVYVRPIRIYGWFTFHDTVNTPTSWEYRIQQLPIPYSGYKLIESPSGSTDTIGLKFYVDYRNKLRMIVEGKSKFHTEDHACVIIDFMETPVA